MDRLKMKVKLTMQHDNAVFRVVADTIQRRDTDLIAARTLFGQAIGFGITACVSRVLGWSSWDAWVMCGVALLLSAGWRYWCALDWDRLASRQIQQSDL
jgi:hypothetical protein